MLHARWLFVATIAIALAGDAAAASPRARRAKPAGRSVAIFEGFRTTAEGSEVYLQFDRAPVDPSLKTDGKSVELVLPGTRANRPFRRLETRYFPTPVSSVETRRRGHDLVVHVTLKEPAAPRLDIREDKGIAVVALVFPPGTPSSEPPPRPGEGEAAPGRPAGTPEKQASAPGGGEDVCALCADLYRTDPEAATQSGCAGECAAAMEKRADAGRTADLQRRASAGEPAAQRSLCLSACSQRDRGRGAADVGARESCAAACMQKFADPTPAEP